MSGGVAVVFVGGPADGEQRVLPGDGRPPPTVKVAVAPDLRATWREGRSPVQRVPYTDHLYRTVPNPADDGPLWCAVYQGASVVW